MPEMKRRDTEINSSFAALACHDQAGLTPSPSPFRWRGEQRTHSPSPFAMEKRPGGEACPTQEAINA
jgi:hypothetical protein